TLIKKIAGFAVERQIPLLQTTTLTRWAKSNLEERNQKVKKTIKKVYFFNDEFTNHNDAKIGITAIKLLNRLGYKVIMPRVGESGRSWLSKGFVRKARKIANENILLLKDIVNEDHPLIGLDPSTILCFRDEYPDLADEKLKQCAERLALSAVLLDEFLASEMDAGHIQKDQFTREEKKIKFHGHCHQKALASTKSLKKILSFPENYSAEEIGSGCCGMAGSFGFEKEHYELSSKIAELIILPEIRKTSDNTIIAASGTSCRQQISEKSGRDVKHPAEVLFDALV
ncbi:FAD-binding oxidoreductase, partial [bacterium]|nr:FAD-binding oxidoreductase [bacterium]